MVSAGTEGQFRSASTGLNGRAMVDEKEGGEAALFEQSKHDRMSHVKHTNGSSVGRTDIRAVD